MKSEPKSAFDRSIGKPRAGKRAPQPRDRADERREALVLFAIALLFVANVVLYLCHHYGLTSSIDPRPRSALTAAAL